MTKLTTIILTFLLASILFSCATKTIYIPIETIKKEKEYIDRWQKDSIYLHDSVFVKHKGDTVWLEKYKTIYKDRLVYDSIFINDSIKVDVPYPIEVSKPYYPKWLVILGCIGALFVGYLGFRILRIFK